MATPALPTTKGFVEVNILDGGYWDAPASLFNSGAKAEPICIYAWPFYIYHPKFGRHVVWGIGMGPMGYSVQILWPRTDRNVRKHQRIQP
jgi:hypothetical protein